MTTTERQALEQERTARYKFANGVFGHGAEQSLQKITRGGWRVYSWNGEPVPASFPRKRDAVKQVQAAAGECMQRVREINARLEADLLDQQMAHETTAERAALDVVERELYGPRGRRRRRLSLDRAPSEATITT